MKKNIFLYSMVFIIMFLSLLMIGLASAADMKVLWNASDTATGYKLEASLDNGATWSLSKDVGTILPVDYVSGSNHFLLCSYTWTGLPDTGLVLIRVSAYNAVGSTTRVDAGAWFNKSWSPPKAVSGAGVQ